VYGGVRAILNTMKWSLHQSGDWGFAFIDSEEAFERAVELGHTEDDRVIESWDRPEEIRDTGLTRALEIRVRHEDLIEVAQPEKVPADALWIDAPPEGYKQCVSLFIARAKKPGIIDVPGFPRPLAGFSMAEGRAALLISELQPVEPNDSAVIASLLPRLVDNAREGGADITSHSLRRIVATDSIDGANLVYDAALRFDEKYTLDDPQSYL
jgi:hypothetical protein